jgi:hypothetical protein
MVTFPDVLGYFAALIQFLGLFLFGITSGWFTLDIIKGPDKPWQLTSIVFSIQLVFVAVLVRFLSPAGLGAYLIGLSGAMIFWGMIKNRDKTKKK